MPNTAPKTTRGHIAFTRNNRSGKVSVIGWKAKAPKRDHLRSQTQISPGAEMIIATPEGMPSRLGREFALKVTGKDATHYHVTVTHSSGKTQIGKEFAIEHQTLKDAAKTAKVFVPAHEAVATAPGTGAHETGDKIRYHVKDEGITRQRKGTIVRPLGRNMYVVQGVADGKTAAAPMHAVHASAIRTEGEARRVKNTKYENTGGTANRLTAEEINRRADAARAATTLTEDQILTSDKFQSMMSRTVSGLAGSNYVTPGNVRRVNGVYMSDDNFEYNDLVSDYMMAATMAFRRELASAPQPDIDSFEAHLAGEEEDSRIFKVATKEGRNAVVAALKERQAHRDRMQYMDEDGEDELDGGGSVVPWWKDGKAISDFSPDMHAQLKRIQEREAAIAGLVGTLTPVEQEVLNRKYGLANIVEPQSAADIAATMKRKEIAHPTGRNWSHEAIKPVHDAAIKRLKGKNNIDEFREFLRALTDHLDMIKSQGAVKIVGPGLLLRRIAGRQVLTACGDDLAKSLFNHSAVGLRGMGAWIDTSRGKNFVIAKGNEMKEIDDLKKSTGIAEEVLKSHVKEYTRTTASGATVQVKEHDDNRVVHHKLDARGNVDSTQKHIDDVHTGGREDGFHHHDLIEHDGPEGKGMFRSGNHIVHGDKDAVAAAWRASRNHEKKHGPKGNAYNYPSSWHKAVTEAAQKKTGKDVKVEHVNVNDYSQMKRLTRS
jgi:hypothetical protein